MMLDGIELSGMGCDAQVSQKEQHEGLGQFGLPFAEARGSPVYPGFCRSFSQVSVNEGSTVSGSGAGNVVGYRESVGIAVLALLHAVAFTCFVDGCVGSRVSGNGAQAAVDTSPHPNVKRRRGEIEIHDHEKACLALMGFTVKLGFMLHLEKSLGACD
ncbi:hypothetical protein XELAEV_18043400mg [Xenopus laevis]|uniref:Uncharacterized protein n=1 Tax=Xenopus laevis TaxID=8355 RepID=A0A974BWK3_XENLA|nr:hypothetical protein XELAEV_18043400mg [Xenopus laevis]